MEWKLEELGKELDGDLSLGVGGLFCNIDIQKYSCCGREKKNLFAPKICFTRTDFIEKILFSSKSSRQFK